MWAQELAVSRLGVDPIRFWSHAPADLALMFEAERHARNRHALTDAWRLSWVIAPHVGKNSVRPSRILLTAPFYDADPEPPPSQSKREED